MDGHVRLHGRSFGRITCGGYHGINGFSFAFK